MSRTIGQISDDLVRATRDLHDVRAVREQAVAVLVDRNGRLEEARQRVNALRQEFLQVIESRARVS